jgi:cell wall assembly regulator SMI1
VDAAWKRIEHWLAAHTSASRDALRPPATTASIDRLQRQMSVAFPADLVASLRRHDGGDSGGFTLPPFYRAMTTAQILGDWTATCQAMAGIPTLSSDWFDQAFIPYATAGDGGCLLADQRPGGHGRVGEFYPDSGTDFDRWPASITELLEGTARSLETGKPYAGRYRPEVAGGILRWEIV